MTADMKVYVANMLAAEKEVEGLHENILKMDAMAYHDALTHVKNKASYNRAFSALETQIQNNTAESGIVMADLNHLKLINDRYGHDKGDAYIVGACTMIANVYKHSPVYRIGGDEFAVILKGTDYQNRDSLLKELRRQFAVSESRTDVHPWQRYSAAVGMAVYSPDTDNSANAVFQRADSKMYTEKTASRRRKNNK